MQSVVPRGEFCCLRMNAQISCEKSSTTIFILFISEEKYKFERGLLQLCTYAAHPRILCFECILIQFWEFAQGIAQKRTHDSLNSYLRRENNIIIGFEVEARLKILSYFFTSLITNKFYVWTITSSFERKESKISVSA